MLDFPTHTFADPLIVEVFVGNGFTAKALEEVAPEQNAFTPFTTIEDART